MVVVIIYFFHRRPIDVKRSLNLCLFLNSESCLMSVLLFGSLSSLKLWFFPHWLYAFVTRYEEMEISRKREHVICLAGFFPQFSFYHTVDFFAGQYNVLTSFFYSIKSWTVLLEDLKARLTRWGIIGLLPLSVCLSAHSPMNTSACTFVLMILNSD